MESTKLQTGILSLKDVVVLQWPRSHVEDYRYGF